MKAMRSTSVPKSDASVHSRRSYDTTLRRERAAETRERIVVAGSELLHQSSIRDWRSLTIRAVAERAGVNERTIYRHFGNERGLRDAVMHRYEEEAGIDLEEMKLDDVADVAARIFEHVSSFPMERKPPLDPTLLDASIRQRAALLGAVSAQAAEWTVSDRHMAAAVLDVLWSVASYERLIVDWDLPGESAISGLRWAIGLVADAVRTEAGPG
jgi:AcrR family transcriptional regulator